MHFPFLGRLGKPKITQSLMTSVNSTCNVTLTCSVEKEEKNVTYRWSPLGEEGNVIRIFQTPDNQELTYTCTAWNPVSNSSDSVSALQLCAGNQQRPSLLSLPAARPEPGLVPQRCVPPSCQAQSPGASSPRRAWQRVQSCQIQARDLGHPGQPLLDPPILCLILTFNNRKYSFPWSFDTPPGR